MCISTVFPEFSSLSFVLLESCLILVSLLVSFGVFFVLEKSLSPPHKHVPRYPVVTVSQVRYTLPAFCIVIFLPVCTRHCFAGKSLCESLLFGRGGTGRRETFSSWDEMVISNGMYFSTGEDGKKAKH